MTPLIVNVALTGCLFSQEDNPNLPVRIEEIAVDAARCYDAGASIFHIHARDPQSHAPTWRLNDYAELIEMLMLRLPIDAIICVSTSGRHWPEYEKRSAVLDLAGLDLASLTVGTVNFKSGPSITSAEMIQKLAARMYERGILPELEVFNWGMVYAVRSFLIQGWLQKPLYVNLFFGSEGSMAAKPYLFTSVVQSLPKCTWGATGVGKYQFKVNCWAVAMGGHVRVGLEDSLWMSKGVKASNVAQVERIVAVGQSMGREPATPEQARAIIWQE